MEENKLMGGKIKNKMEKIQDSLKIWSKYAE